MHLTEMDTSVALYARKAGLSTTRSVHALLTALPISTTAKAIGPPFERDAFLIEIYLYIRNKHTRKTNRHTKLEN